MKTLEQLINIEDSGWILVQEWMTQATNHIEVLPKNKLRAEQELLSIQVTTRSPMGSIIYETGGILIDHGWLRILASGHPKLDRGITEWNHHKTFHQSDQELTYLLIADDVLGGYFAINNGKLGEAIGKIYYFAPDTLVWENLDVSYSEFLTWAFNGDIAQFYQVFRWQNWQIDIQSLNGNQVFSFMPMLFTKEGKDIEQVDKKIIPISESYDFHFATTLK